MTTSLLQTLCAYIPRDRVEHILCPDNHLYQDGVALIADIAGFTPLTEALTHGLSPDRGAEQLTRALDSLFAPLIEKIHAYRGSVIKFGGDALIVWYGRQPGRHRSTVIRRALTSAWQMQQVIARHGQIPTPIGQVTLKMKVGLAYGPVKRFNLGLPQFGYEDVLGGLTLDRMAAAEHAAEPGDIVVDPSTWSLVSPQVAAIARRHEFAVVKHLLQPAAEDPWPPFSPPDSADDNLTARVKAYVPQQVYDLLAMGRTQVAELKPVVSLFIQFHGIDYDTDPQVGQKLQTYFATCQEIVARYGGRLNRLITGDKGSLLHIIFGAPKTVEEQEARAVRCALDLQQATSNLSFIQMQRIGIALGRVFAGPVGSTARHDYTTIGDSINLSARLMQNAAADQILIEENVYAQLDNSFRVTNLDRIRVKGKAAPIPVFAVEGLVEQMTPTTPKATLPLFGRESEMLHLDQAVAQLFAGKGGVISLMGEVGMGKSHVLAALRTKIAAQPVLDIGWAEGICLSYGQTLSGYLFIDLLRDLIQLPPATSPEKATDHLRDFCATLFGPARLDSTYPYIARFMNLPLAQAFTDRLASLSGENLRWQLFEVLKELLVHLLKRRPLILALDDLQWADPTSMQLVETILPLTEDSPLLIITALRPDRDTRAWHLRERLVTGEATQGAINISLGGLNKTAAQRLLAYYAPGLSDEISDHLLDKSGGNPLFLVELVRTMEAQGLLSEPQQSDAIRVQALDLPNSVQGLLLAQIDRLRAEARHTLQMASVIGKSFLVKVLSALATGGQNLQEHLSTLEHETYILPDLATKLGESYSFRHILIQESAYSTLLYERRRGYHREVAQALEMLFPTLIGEQAGLLAFHYEQAEDIDKAVDYHLQAADQARLLYANEEAEALYKKALDLFDHLERTGATPNAERRAKTFLKIAQVRSNALDFEGAQTYYDQAFTLFDRSQPGTAVVENGTTHPSRVFKLGVDEPETLDPGRAETTGSVDLVSILFEGLVELDSELNVIPAVARRWYVDKSGTRYTFELHQHLHWSDGTLLTAHDFVFAWRQNLSPQSEADLGYLLYAIQGAEAYHQGKNENPASIGIKAIDTFTLEINLEKPVNYLLYLLTRPIAYPQPAHLINQQDKTWSKPDHLIGNGPFQVDVWTTGAKEVSLKKNPFYRGFAQGNLDSIVLRFAKPEFSDYLNEEIDWYQVERSELTPNQLEAPFVVQYLSTFFIVFSCQHPPFDQVAVRQAFAQSIDQEALVKQVTSNLQRAATGGIVPPGMPGHSPEIGLPFDPESARQLLSDSDYKLSPDGPELVFAAFPGTKSPPYLQQSWQQNLGINVQFVEDISVGEILDGLQNGNINIALIAWDVEYPDPDSILRVLFHGDSPMNYFGWRNESFDRLVEQAATLHNQQDRLSLYHQADKILVAEDTAIVPLFYYQTYGLMRSGFKLADSNRIIRGGSLKLKNILAV